MTQYTWLISDITFEKVKKYKQLLENRSSKAGKFFAAQLQGHVIEDLNTADFLQLLIQTKMNRVAPTHTQSTWTIEEESILGDLALLADGAIAQITTPVLKATEEGEHSSDYYALHEAADTDLSESAFNAMYERRLLPLLLHLNAQAVVSSQRVVVNIPGMISSECSSTAFSARNIEVFFREALKYVLKTHHTQLKAIDIVHYDAYFDDCSEDFGHIQFRTLNDWDEKLGDAYPKDSAQETHQMMRFLPSDAAITAEAAAEKGLIIVVATQKEIPVVEPIDKSSPSPEALNAVASMLEPIRNTQIETDGWDYSFHANCFFSLAVIGGGALLVIGLCVANPVLMGAGAGVLIVGVLGLAASMYGMFNQPQGVDDTTEVSREAANAKVVG